MVRTRFSSAVPSSRGQDLALSPLRGEFDSLWDYAHLHSLVAQRKSRRLLTVRLLVRIQPGEHEKTRLESGLVVPSGQHCSVAVNRWTAVDRNHRHNDPDVLMHQSPSGRWGLPYKQNVVGFNSHLVHAPRGCWSESPEMLGVSDPIRTCGQAAKAPSSHGGNQRFESSHVHCACSSKD
jgi:hypothetical protein